MKILFVNDYSELVGGAEISISELMKGLKERGHTVKLFGGDRVIKKSNKFLKLLQLLFNFHYAYKFKKTLDDFQPDVIHINNIFNELSPSFLIHLKNYRVIMTVHDNRLFFPVSRQNERTGKYCKQKLCLGCTNCVGFSGMIYETIKRTIYKPLLNNIDVYIGCSDYINALIKRLRIGKVAKINYLCTLLDYSPISTYENILYMGRLSEEKGIHFVIQSLPEVIKKFPTVKLTIVGNGEQKQYLEALTKELQLQKNVTFTGSVKHKETQTYYKNATIVVVPSTWDEPFGKSGVEAMSVGRPVVGTRVGGISEWLIDEETGFLVEPENPEQIAEKIIQLFSNKKQLQTMGKKARKKAEEFSIDNHVEKLLQVYRSE